MTSVDKIKVNIEKYGYHLYTISDAPIPRYSYTIGLLESSINSEIILAGAYSFDLHEIELIIEKTINNLKLEENTIKRSGDLGNFKLIETDPTWGREILLGAMDYYSQENIPALQLVPEEKYWTMEIPDMSKKFDPAYELAWRWLVEPWKYNIPVNSIAATNLSTLKGEIIIEASRWEDDYWELFSCPGDALSEKDSRIVPLGTLLSIDATLARVINLQINQSIWRNNINTEWQSWR
jgi:hypothetical protein